MKPETDAGRTLLVALRQPYPIPPAKPEDIVAAIEREAVARFLDTAEPKVAEALHDIFWASGVVHGPTHPGAPHACGSMESEDSRAVVAHLRATVEGT
jgi:hypothetical protein